MKKHNRVKIYPLLCSTFLLSASLCPLGIPASAAEVQEQAAESAAVPQEESALTVPEFILSKCYLLVRDNYESIADGYYQSVMLSEESAKQFPALSASLTQINERITDTCKTDFEELAGKAREYAAANGMENEDTAEATLEGRITPVRQDDKAVSFFASCYSYVPGNAQGMTTFKGYSLDSSTGEEITLDQILKEPENRAALAAAVSENLRFKSTGEPAGGYDESVSVSFANEETSPAWVLGDNGLIFRYEPDAVGTEAEGVLESEVSFTAYPDLFTDAYGPHEGAYTLPIDTVYPVLADLNGDGQAEKISLNARPDEEGGGYSYTALRVAIGDKELLHETFFFNASGVLVHTGGGKNYLYVQTITDNDYRILSIFDLNQETPVFIADLNGTGFPTRFRVEKGDSDLFYLDEQLLSSPDSFCLDTHMDLMSTYSATRRYKVGPDGMPVTLSEQFDIYSDLMLTSITDLVADTVDPVTGAVTKQGASLPKGTQCRFYRTNGSDTVDLITEDGTVYRFLVTEQWPQKINGLRLDEAFEGTMFAG